MKKTWLLFLVLGLWLFDYSAAQAFSTEQVSGENSDGTPKFADPDEQMPAFLTGGMHSEQSGLQPLAPDEAPVTPLTPNDYDQGAAAFDQAYSHLQKH